MIDEDRNGALSCSRYDTDLASSLACAWDSDTDTLTISDAVTGSLSAGTDTGFIINTITNPISQAACELTLTSYDVNGDSIDQSVVSFSATAAAGLDPDDMALTAVDTSIVQETSEFSLVFKSTVPLASGC